jgi:hypothetical protein
MPAIEQLERRDRTATLCCGRKHLRLAHRHTIIKPAMQDQSFRPDILRMICR